jgi:hypothetical protein
MEEVISTSQYSISCFMICVLCQEKYETQLKDTRARELMRMEEVAILDKVGA